MTLSAAQRERPATLSAADLASLLRLPTPTAEQAAVIEAPLGPAAVIAGAGSGKTETMAARVVWLVANRLVRPDAVLGLTFTRKAASELSGRIRRRLAQWRAVVGRVRPDEPDALAELLAGEPTVLTYAAYAGRLVAEHALRLGCEPSARLLSPAMAWQLADEASRRYPGTLPRDIGAPSSVTRWVLALSGQLADHLTTADDVDLHGRQLLDWIEGLPPGAGARTDCPKDVRTLLATTRHRLALLALIRGFAEAKASMAAVDFADQMVLAARLAALPEVAGCERARFGAVLLDEYQDTGHAQVEMLRSLFSGGHPVTAVGDPFQSIYGWRGASAGNMGRFADDFPAADRSGQRLPATVYTLATSFRNDRRILRAANRVAAPLRRTSTLAELRPGPAAQAGEVVAARLQTVDDEARWVADRLASAWNARPAGARTAAVLVRRRSQIPLLVEALQHAGLPVEVVGLGGLLTTPEVLDVASTLRVLAEPDSGTALARLLTGARWRIGPADLAALHQRARELSGLPDGSRAEPVTIVEALDDLGAAGRYSAAGYRRLSALAGELRRLRRRLTAPLPDLVAEVERMIGVDIEVAARPDRREVGRVHLDRFLEVAAQFAAEAAEATLPAFLAFLRAAEEEENGLEPGAVVVESERVQVLTVHAAKGLEWDVVAVPGLVSSVFPADPRSIDWTRTRQELPTPLRGDRADLPDLACTQVADRRELAAALQRHRDDLNERHAGEERRLAYVAFTRARSALFASGYTWDSSVNPRVPSPFLIEVAEVADLDTWHEPDAAETNPLTEHVRLASWPADPFGPVAGESGGGRRAAVEDGAALVRAAAGLLPLPTGPRAGRWSADVDRLLAERAQAGAASALDVELPVQLSVSQLVELRRDPAALARSLRRPLPRRPAPHARRGTEFHRWLEQRWNSDALWDVDDLPGAADETATDADFAELRDAFLASVWASRTPTEVEVPFEMPLADGRIIRGRMDAVFGNEVVGWTVVDWKTGTRPSGAAEAAAAVQLGAYRLAWARLCGLRDHEISRVRAVFHYVRTNETVEPAALLDAEGLRALIASVEETSH